MEEDEQVILQNSPLDAYLQKVTDSQFSTYQCTNEKSFVEEILDNKMTGNENESEGNNIFSRQNDSIQSDEILKMCRVFFDSNLLNDDDASLLVEIRDEVSLKMDYLKLEVGEKQSKNSAHFNIPKTWLLFGLLVLSISVFGGYVSLSSLLFILFMLIIIATTVWRYCWKDNIDDIKHNEDILKFVTNFHHIDKLLDQSVTHIKEVEVINNGFQMFRQSRSIEITGKKGNKCLKLRNGLLDFVIDLFMELRVNQRMLLQTYADELFTVKEEYFASVPLVKFNELISYKNPEDSLQLPNISLDKLKSMIYLYRALLSEFTLSLIVCFYYMGDVHHNDLLNSMNQIMVVSEKHLDSLEQALQKSVQLTFKKRDINGLTRPLKTHANPIDGRFYKCRLNLYSSLSRLDESESLIHENPTSFNLAALENLLLQFYMNLDNAKACIEDVLSIYKPSKADNKETSSIEETMQEDIDSNTILTTELPEQEVGDMLYEGESLDAALRSVEPVSLEDLEQQLKESRESKRLLRELKSIFAVKDSPVGLLSFPLTKAEEGDISNEQEPSIEEELLARKQKKKKAIITGDQDFYGEGEENLENKSYIPETPIGLPVHLLQGLSSFAPVCEEKFGSSDEEDS